MVNELAAVIERDGERFVAFCPETPGATGQGTSVAEAKANLAEAIALVLEDRREEGLRGIPPHAVTATVQVRG